VVPKESRQGTQAVPVDGGEDSTSEARWRRSFRDISTRSSPSTPPFYIFVAIVLLVALRVVRRTFANYSGTKFSLSRTLVFAGVYIAIGFVFSSLSFLEGVSPLLVIPQVLLATAAAYWSYRYTDKRISFWKAADGSLFFRGGILIYLIYLAGLITRLSIDVVLIGPKMFSFSTGVQLSGTALYGSIGTDLVLIFGVGLLIGRSIRVFRKHRRIQRREEPVPDSDPKLLKVAG